MICVKDTGDSSLQWDNNSLDIYCRWQNVKRQKCVPAPRSTMRLQWEAAAGTRNFNSI